MKIQASESTFHSHWLTWKLLGLIPTENYKALYYIYSFVLIVGIIILFPIHLTLFFFSSTIQADELFKNLAIVLPAASCSIKTICFWWNINKLYRISELLRKLDKRIEGPDEVEYYEKNIFPTAKRISNWFNVLCICVVLSSELGVLAGGVLFGEWGLMYPAYFPFNWKTPTFNYVVAHFYQLLGEVVLTAHNFCNDTIGGIGLSLLAGHVRLLRIRVSQIGHETDKPLTEHNIELLKCIEDYKDLLEYRRTFLDIISVATIFQFLFSGINICVVIVFMLFYLDNIFAYAYYSILLFAVLIELYPSCFYGTAFEYEFEHLTYALFSCNWLQQNREFKQNLGIFIEQSLKNRKMTALGLIHINMNTFFATCKMAYSLFAVVLRMK